MWERPEEKLPTHLTDVLVYVPGSGRATYVVAYYDEEDDDWTESAAVIRIDMPVARWMYIPRMP